MVGDGTTNVHHEFNFFTGWLYNGCHPYRIRLRPYSARWVYGYGPYLHIWPLWRYGTVITTAGIRVVTVVCLESWFQLGAVDNRHLSGGWCLYCLFHCLLGHWLHQPLSRSAPSWVTATSFSAFAFAAIWLSSVILAGSLLIRESSRSSWTSVRSERWARGTGTWTTVELIPALPGVPA